MLLPLELRNKIWHESLPEKDGPALFFYKPEAWNGGVPVPGDKYYDDSLPGEHRTWFLEDQLDHVRVDLPQLRVDWEAHQIAMQWARSRGIDVKGGGFTLARCMDHADAMMLTSEADYFSFAEQPWNIEVGTDGSWVDTPEVHRVAIPEQMVTQNPALDILEDMWSTTGVGYTLYIVIGMPDGLDWRQSHENVQRRRWSLDMNKSRAYTWDQESASFSWEQGDQIGSDFLCRWIEKEAGSVVQYLTERPYERCEIRAIHVDIWP